MEKPIKNTENEDTNKPKIGTKPGEKSLILAHSTLIPTDPTKFSEQKPLPSNESNTEITEKGETSLNQTSFGPFFETVRNANLDWLSPTKPTITVNPFTSILLKYLRNIS